MITMEGILSIEKDALPEAAEALLEQDIARLVEWLSLKDDDVRYRALLLLKQRSTTRDDVYPYFHIFRDKLASANSYQRSIGLMLMAENAKWDKDNRMAEAIDAYLDVLRDEKPITVRQSIQSLRQIVPHAPALAGKITDALISLDLSAVKETMRKSILLDVLNALLLIRRDAPSPAIDDYIMRALSGGVLDAKSKKQIGALMR
ncbi:hypothetical protein ACH6CV_11450 [Bacillota bacterium Meth-B3]